MKKYFAALCAALLLFSAAALPVRAESGGQDAGSGYIVRLNADAAEGAVHGLLRVDTAAEADALVAGGAAEYAEPDTAVTLFDADNDYYYQEQWNLAETGAETFWESGLSGAGVRVAVIDSGVYREHEDLSADALAEGENLYDPGGSVEDVLGHGTLVAGILAALRNNGVGIAGLLDQVTLVPLRCFENKDEASVLDIALGIYAAVDDYDCGVICLSLGSSEDLATLREAVNYAAAQGVIVVAAAGNDGTTQAFYPAAYDSVVGVGAYDENGVVCDFSQKNDSVFVTAPGDGIYSTYIGRPDAYAVAGGTSFAAPHVAAMAAAAKALFPELTTDEFKTLLMATSTDAGASGYDTAYGYGRINMAAFADALLSLRDSGEAAPAFDDISGHWAASDIAYCAENGIFGGVSDTEFQPEGSMTRAMLVTVLMRLDGGTTGSEETAVPVFTDVTDSGAWYYDAVYWAAENGLVSGYEDGSFRPDAPVTREQIAAILYRHAGSPQADTAGLTAFSDAGEVSAYARQALAWAVDTGLLNGVGEGRLAPGDGATRAQVAALMARLSRAQAAA